MAKDVIAGLTGKECCSDCGPSGCVISGKGYCAHPSKGGLHAGQMQDTAAVKRFQAAQSKLKRAKG